MLRRSMVETSIPTSSMADIAFLLLVFFLVTTHFLEDKGIGMLLPEVEGNPVRIKHVMRFVVHDENDVILFLYRLPTLHFLWPSIHHSSF